MLCRTVIVISAILFGIALTGVPSQAAEDISIGAGDRTGPYYAFGRRICRLLSRKIGGMTCSLLPTPRGDTAESYSNLINIQNGAADIGLARSDWHYFGVTGTGPLKHIFERLDTVRSLFSIHSLPATLVVRGDSRITKLDDLAGKRVNIGRAHSDDRRSIDLVMSAKKWTAGNFLLAEKISRSEQTLAFCHDRIQAMFFTVSHPNAAIRQVAELCNAVLVNLSDEVIDDILAAKPYLASATIPKGTYPGMTDTIKTFGATVTVVTSADAPEDLVYSIVKAVFENLSDLKKMHPALRNLDPKLMVRNGLTAPLHIGAIRYYRENGLH